MKSLGNILLSNGTKYQGISFGARANVIGEFVFNTEMVGYPETFTDPSYRGQILVLTYPLIGNYGVANQSFESDRICIAGLVVNDYSEQYSHWTAIRPLSEWLEAGKIPALYGVDTRSLTKLLRVHGTMKGGIFMENQNTVDMMTRINNKQKNENFVAMVSCKKAIIYTPEYQQHSILLIDCGVKNSIIYSLMKRNCKVIRVPWNANFETINAPYDGVVVSNGPGDPKICRPTVRFIKHLLKKKKPVFGICLGHQLIALAIGADTYKLKYGHRSQNQPCVNFENKRCYITTQNHGYAVKNSTIPNDWKIWFTNANDGTNEGMKHKSAPFFSVQFHPEARPGPFDTDFIFDEFVKLL